MSLEESKSFTSEQFTSEINSCMNSRANGLHSLSIFHLKNVGPLATEHLITTLYNDSLKSCHLPSIWNISLVIAIPNPSKDSLQGTHTDPFLCYAQQPRSSRSSSYPLSTNLFSQLKINTVSDPGTRLHLPSSSSQQTSRPASTIGNLFTVQCV